MSVGETGGSCNILHKSAIFSTINNSLFLNVDDIVIIIDGCRKFQPAQINLVKFHIYVHMQ